MDKPTEGASAEAKKAEQHRHYAAPEVEERDEHEYEGEGVGRRESLRPDQPLPAKKTDDAGGAAAEGAK